MPDDIPAHPYAVAMEIVHPAPHAEATRYPWKEPKDLIPQAVPSLCTHGPVKASLKTQNAARGSRRRLHTLSAVSRRLLMARPATCAGAHPTATSRGRHGHAHAAIAVR